MSLARSPARPLLSTIAPLALSVFALGTASSGCSAAGPNEDPGIVGRSSSALTVDQEIAKGGCTSAAVQGLSDQILEELTRCVEPGFLVRVPSGGNLVNNANHAYLEKPAATGLAAALASKPGSTLTVNSMYRTVAQQYVLFRQASCFPAVADPGKSNHETGLAFDTDDRTTWQTALEAHGFKWFGTGDPVHFDFVGAGAVDLRGKDVLAFQRLWNRNHASDTITEDGGWGPETEARMKESPADGFAIGAMCDVTPKDAGVDARDAAADVGRDAKDDVEGDAAKSDAKVEDAASDSASLSDGSDGAEAGPAPASESSAGCGCRIEAKRDSSAPITAIFTLVAAAMIHRRSRRIPTRPRLC